MQMEFLRFPNVLIIFPFIHPLASEPASKSLFCMGFHPISSLIKLIFGRPSWTEKCLKTNEKSNLL